MYIWSPGSGKIEKGGGDKDSKDGYATLSDAIYREYDTGNVNCNYYVSATDSNYNNELKKYAGEAGLGDKKFTWNIRKSEEGFYISAASPSDALYDNAYLAAEFEEGYTGKKQRDIPELKLYDINENDIKEYESLLWFLVPSNEEYNIMTTVYRETLEDGGEYYIENVNSGKLLSSTGNTYVEQNVDLRMPNQRWRAHKKDGGYWSFSMDLQENLYLSVDKGSKKDEARICMQKPGSCDESAFLWHIDYTADGSLIFSSKCGEGDLIMAVRASWTDKEALDNGAGIYQKSADKIPEARGRWIIRKAMDVQAPIESGKEYKLQNIHSEKYLTHRNVGKGFIMQSIDYKMSNQSWIARDLGDGYWSFESAGQRGYYLSVGEDSNYHTGKIYAIQAADGKLTSGMRWKFIPTVNNNWALSPESGMGLYVLTIPIWTLRENGKKEYEIAEQQRFEDEKLMNDEWRFIEVKNEHVYLIDGGYYRISNAESDMLVSSFSDSSHIKQYTDKEGMKDEQVKKRISQIWKIHKGTGIYSDCYSFSPKERPEYVLTVGNLFEAAEVELKLQNKNGLSNTSSMWWKPVKTENNSYIWISKSSGETLVMAVSDKDRKKEGKSLTQERYQNKELKNDEWHMEEIRGLNHRVSYYADGKILKTISVGDGDKAPKLTPPQKQGYTFVRWIPEIQHVKRDINLHAEYKRNVYKVRFVYGDNNELIKELDAGYGEKVTAPKVPEKRGNKKRRLIFMIYPLQTIFLWFTMVMIM